MVEGTGRFISLNQVEVLSGGTAKTISFEQAIIAPGRSRCAVHSAPGSRVIDSTARWRARRMLKRLLVIGGGIIGLEMATAYHALGAKVTIVEFMEQIIPGADRDIVTPLMKRIQGKYETIHLKTKVTKVEATPDGLVVYFEGGKAPATDVFDRILVAVGRRPNGRLIGAENAGVIVDESGYIRRPLAGRIAQKPNDRGRLLRARSNWPRDCAAQCRDELAPPHGYPSRKAALD